MIPYGLTSMLATAGAIASVESIGPSVSARASVAGLPAPDRASRWLGMGGMGGGVAMAGASAGAITLGRSRLAGIGGIGGACRPIGALAEAALADPLREAGARAVVFTAAMSVESGRGGGDDTVPATGGRPVASPALPTAAGVALAGGTGAMLGRFATGATGATTGASGGRLTTVADAGTTAKDGDGDGDGGAGALQSLLTVVAAGLTTRRGSMKW